MPSLMSDDQIQQVRDALRDIGDTFAFPITLIQTTYTEGAFASAPVTVETELTAIRDFKASDTDGMYTTGFGATNAGEYELYVGWEMLENAGLITPDDGTTITSSDLIRMEGEIYEIKPFGGVGDMTTRPSFLKIFVKRRFQSPNGAATV